MAINLDDHKFFEYQSKQEVVPLKIALQAIEEVQKKYENFDNLEKKLNESINLLNSNMEGLNPLIKKIDD
jgi:prefoldin subunit 5